jgi:hypothetical protein
VSASVENTAGELIVDDAVIDDEVSKAWDEWETSCLRAEQERVDLVRIRGYALACCKQADVARDELDHAVQRLVSARETADEALERCRRVCEYAERVSTFAARCMAGDTAPETMADAAAALEELFG